MVTSTTNYVKILRILSFLLLIIRILIRIYQLRMKGDISGERRGRWTFRSNVGCTTTRMPTWHFFFYLFNSIIDLILNWKKKIGVSHGRWRRPRTSNFKVPTLINLYFSLFFFLYFCWIINIIYILKNIKYMFSTYNI